MVFCSQIIRNFASSSSVIETSHFPRPVRKKVARTERDPQINWRFTVGSPANGESGIGGFARWSSEYLESVRRDGYELVTRHLETAFGPVKVVMRGICGAFLLELVSADEDCLPSLLVCVSFSSTSNSTSALLAIAS